MEFAEAGLSDWPQPSSSSLRHQQSTSPVKLEDDDEAKKRRKAEKRERKEQRAARRASKQARREMKGKGKSSAAAEGADCDGEVLIPSSGYHRADGDSDRSQNSIKQESSNRGDVQRPVTDPRSTSRSADPLQSSQTEKSSQKSRLVVELPPRSKADSFGPSASPSKKTTKTAKRPRSSDDEEEDEADTGAGPSSTKKAVMKTSKKGKKKSKVNGDAPSEAGPSTITSTTSPNKTSTSSTAKGKKRSRPNGSVANADAGPSTPRETPKTRKSRKSKVSGSRSSSTDSSTTSRGSPRALTDDEWREKLQLTSTHAMNEYLAAKFYPVSHIKRLEAAGILAIRKGKLNDKEIAAVRRHLDLFRQTYRLDREQLVEIIMAKGQANVRDDYPDFWQQIALELPGRPLRYVVKQVQRMYDPRGRKGPWKASEDNELIRAHRVHPGEWTKIAAIVDRTEQDCRDRWIKEIANSENRHTGMWTVEEEHRLLQIIKETNAAIGTPALSLEAPWDLVSAKMDYERGPTQCRIKWQRDMHPRSNGALARSRVEQKSAEQGKFTMSDKKVRQKPTSPNKQRKEPQPPLTFKSQEFIDSDLESEEGADHDPRAGEKEEEEDIEVAPTQAEDAETDAETDADKDEIEDDSE